MKQWQNHAAYAIYECQQAVAHFAALTVADVVNCWAHQRVAERTVMIISEAIRFIPTEILAAAPDIPWAKIKGIGNIIRHDYEDVDPAIMYDIVKNKFPPLLIALEKIFKQEV